MEVYKLYPQFYNKDRRQHDISVEIDRRANKDRRTQPANNLLVAERRIDTKLRQDITQVKDVFQAFKANNSTVTSFTNDLEVGAVSSIPYVRRLRGANDAFEHHDYVKAAGTVLLMLMNVKEDWRDILKIFRKPNTPYSYQIPFSFTRGTPLEKIKILDKFDKTLNNTVIGGKILEAIGVNKYEYFVENKSNLKKTLVAFKAEGNPLAKIMARAFMRIPILSFAFLSLLEVPSIIKSEDRVKQTIKSAVTVTSIITGAALAGAIGAYFGPLGSLTGIGIGSFYAGKFAKKINSTIG